MEIHYFVCAYLKRISFPSYSVDFEKTLHPTVVCCPVWPRIQGANTFPAWHLPTSVGLWNIIHRLCEIGAAF